MRDLVLRLSILMALFGAAGCPEPPVVEPPPPPPETIDSLLDAQLEELISAADELAAEAEEGDLDSARRAFEPLWVAAIKPRYVLEQLLPDLFDTLYAPIGLHDVPATGLHAVEAALFGRVPDVAAAGPLARQIAAEVRAERDAAAALGLTDRVRGRIPVTEEALLSGLVSAWRLPIELVAGTDTPLFGPSAESLRALFISTRGYLELSPGLLAGAPALGDALDALGAAVSAGPAEDALALPGFIAAAADFAAELADAAEARGVTLPFSDSDFNELNFVPEAEFPENYEAPQAALLGQLLFFDPVLSDPALNPRRSCASCHKPDKGFGDARVKGLAASGGDLPRNTPTILNASLQHGSFWDSRVNDLNDQADKPLEAAEEMGPPGNLIAALTRIAAIPEYVTLFNEAFPGVGIDIASYRRAVAAYQATGLTLDSPADRFLRGDLTALSETQQRGLLLYFGKARCHNCHYAPLFAGTQAPDFAVTNSRTIGVPDEVNDDILDEDLGLFGFSQNPIDRHAFKVPTLRNISETGPYMHNGAFATLATVIDFYNAGGGPGLGFNVPNADPRMIELELTPAEQGDLEVFLLTLTDTTTARPAVPDAVPSGLPVGGGD